MAATAAKEDTDQTLKEFKEAVNMTAAELEKWLGTEDSQKVGYKGEDGKDEDAESVGHQSGRRIVELLRKKKSDYEEDDYAHMHKVVGYVHRHLAQRPGGDVEHTNWRYSLMNWGHDPTKGK